MNLLLNLLAAAGFLCLAAGASPPNIVLILADDLGWADTTPWLGFVNVLADPWIWSASINNWMYMPEESVTEGGSWAYVLGQ